MARTKGAKGTKLKLYKGVGKSLRYMRRTGRRMGFNPKPVFTETLPLGDWDPNTGGIQTFNISQVGQVNQYSNLYYKYRILACRLIIIPSYGPNMDENSAQYNQSVGLSQFGLGRLVMAINDTPQVPAPLTENDVLQDNGCKIMPIRFKNTIKCRPVPDVKDANNNLITLSKSNRFLNFASPNIAHYGISYWYSQPLVGTPTIQNKLKVYCKMTFQLADPK